MNRHPIRLFDLLYCTVSVGTYSKELLERLSKRNAEAVELSVAMFHEVSKTDLHKQIEELKIQLDTARKKADVAGSDLMAELEHCKDEKSVLELKIAQYRLDQLQKSMPAKLSDSDTSFSVTVLW